jgi:hypothetical protein
MAKASFYGKDLTGLLKTVLRVNIYILALATVDEPLLRPVRSLLVNLHDSTDRALTPQR